MGNVSDAKAVRKTNNNIKKVTCLLQIIKNKQLLHRLQHECSLIKKCHHVTAMSRSSYFSGCTEKLFHLIIIN